MPETFNVLLVEDNEKHQIIIQHELDKVDLDIDCTCLFLKEDFIEHLSSQPVDLIISDFKLPNFSGMEALKMKKELKPEIPFIFISGMMGEDLAVEAMLAGASDYVMKEDMRRLNPAVKRELQHHYKQAQNQKKLAETEEKYKSLVHSLDAIVWEADVDPLRLTFISPKFEPILGFNHVEWNSGNRFWLDKVHPDDYGEVKDFYEKASSAEGDYQHEFRFIRQDGKVVWLMDSVTTLWVQDSLKMRGLIIDTSVQHQREEKLKEALKEKKSLLSEVHHRVKNNLAVISGMMQLQYFSESNPEVQEKLLSSVGRIKTMALIHEILYHSESFGKLDAGSHLRDIVDLSKDHANFESYNISIQSERIYLNINQAVPFFLIVHEVIDNTFQHAVPNSANHTIDIHIKTNKQQVNLQITDSGNQHSVDLPHDFLENDLSESGLGITIIKELTRQLCGNCSYSATQDGTTFSLAFAKEDQQKGSTANSLVL
ncbi:histidine kinase dimerization/phosphoacceptor domain -containing protein [Gracilimonas mengyeensis]|uniref:histidine kinase n=1 Tax=Gracilimonas mengyeensis TaxID=1302730 RepID=A0A521B1I5_9BACT|nr:histidine kinase dimerization/phosphoacceptor domain -containing protein [Gracilimonas mengyeensis]SMO40640.1 PAS domain S-box-containing protein [Gracilimonas mengyeensis]